LNAHTADFHLIWVLLAHIPLKILYQFLPRRHPVRLLQRESLKRFSLGCLLFSCCIQPSTQKCRCTGINVFPSLGKLKTKSLTQADRLQPIPKIPVAI
jgi:hypothetical protein